MKSATWVGLLSMALAGSCASRENRLSAGDGASYRSSNRIPHYLKHVCPAPDSDHGRSSTKISSWQAVAFEDWANGYWLVSADDETGPATMQRVSNRGPGGKRWTLRATWTYDRKTGRLSAETTEPGPGGWRIWLRGQMNPGHRSTTATVRESFPSPASGEPVTAELPAFLVLTQETDVLSNLERMEACASEALSRVQ
jgi:hypothetical protein